jgi:hypothetical protein
MVSGGLEFSTFGYQRAMSDFPYTCFLSSTRTDLWETAYTSVFASMTPDRYRLETKDGLRISLQRGDTYTNSANLGGLMFRVPDKSAGGIYAGSFSWSTTLPTNWQVVMQFFDSSGAFINGYTIATGNGALQTGSLSVTSTNAYTIVFYIVNVTGASYVATGETGTQYALLTNILFKFSSSASFTANEIAYLMVSNVSFVNSSQLSSTTALIQNPGIVLRDEIIEDQYPSDILDYLVSLGDDQTPPRQWVWGVDLDQALYFRPRGSGRQWYVDIVAPDIEQTIDNLFNSVYPVYQEAGGRTLRGTTSTDATSVQQYGLTRRRAVQVQTTSSTQANTHRDAALADGKDPRPRVGIEISALYSASGMRVHPWVARPGDTISIRNLPPTISADVDRLRTFVLSELEFDCDSGLATLTPESPTPSLDVMVAREAAGVNRAPTVLRPPIVIR